MSNETLFFVCGIALAVSAVLFSMAALKAKNFPGKAFPAVVLWFAILAGGAATFSVLHAKDEEHHKEAEFEHAGEEFEAEDEDAAAGEAEEEAAAPSGEGAAGGSEDAVEPKGKTASGPGGTIPLAADVSDLAYDKSTISSKPGKVTIDLTNPSALEHDVAIELDGKQLADSELIANGATTTASADLAPGTYTFYCTVPGHREAGMEGQLTVK